MNLFICANNKFYTLFIHDFLYFIEINIYNRYNRYEILMINLFVIEILKTKKIRKKELNN